MSQNRPSLADSFSSAISLLTFAPSAPFLLFCLSPLPLPPLRDSSLLRQLSLFSETYSLFHFL